MPTTAGLDEALRLTLLSPVGQGLQYLSHHLLPPRMHLKLVINMRCLCLSEVLAICRMPSLSSTLHIYTLELAYSEFL